MEENRNALMEIFRWLDLQVNERGTISVLDARGADDSAVANVQDELKSQSADIFIFVDDGDASRPPRKREIENLAAFLQWNQEVAPGVKVIGVSLFDPERNRARDDMGKSTAPEKQLTKLRAALEENTAVRNYLTEIMQVPLVREQSADIQSETETVDLGANATSTQSGPRRNAAHLARSRCADRNRAGPGEINHGNLHGDRYPAHPIGRSAHSYDAAISNGLRHHVFERTRTEFARRHGVYGRARRKCRRRHAAAGGNARAPEVFPRLGERRLRHGGRCGNLCDRTGCNRLFHRRRLAQGRETNLYNQPEKLFEPETGSFGFGPLNKL